MIPSLLTILTPFAGVWRAFAYRFRCFGDIPTGLLTWAGLLVAMPLACWPLTDAAAFAWLLLVARAFLVMCQQWVSEKPRRPDGISHAWAGDKEVAWAASLAVGSAAFIGTRVGLFVGACYLASVLKNGLIRLRLELMTDGGRERVTAPFRDFADALGAFLGGVGLAVPVACGYSARATARSATFTWRAAFAAFRWLFIPKPAAPSGQAFMAADGTVFYAQAPRRGFWRSVGGTVVGNLLIHYASLIVGFPVIAGVAVLVLTIPLRLIGVEVKLPDYAKQPVRSVMTWVREEFGERKDEIKDYIEDHKEEIEEKVAEGKRKAAERVRLEKDKLLDEAEQRGRRVVKEAGKEAAKEAAKEVTRRIFPWGGD